MTSNESRIKRGRTAILELQERIREYENEISRIEIEIRKRENDTEEFIEQQKVNPKWYKPCWMIREMGTEISEIRYFCS